MNAKIKSGRFTETPGLLAKASGGKLGKSKNNQPRRQFDHESEEEEGEEEEEKGIKEEPRVKPSDKELIEKHHTPDLVQMKQNSKTKDEHERHDSEYYDLNQILNQNVNINNVHYDGEGHLHDLNKSPNLKDKFGEDEQFF
mmetsp:Transcript_39106/g.37433  ORF Transcript_39106/g.37433 Transcript_39106/m.37433 type:complete len:141 (-) Transcript_39106:772-1194(-)